ncbi:hypothetical protein J6590_020339 [Homalodisca vitripennis]|nr:hypothetical protein J6590_020339 [Homalodisca vitripennis]
MSSDELESQVVEDSGDSSPPSSPYNNNNSHNNNNNVIKMGPLFLSQSAELYYKQLLAANVAVLSKPRLAATVRTTLAKSALDQSCTRRERLSPYSLWSQALPSPTLQIPWFHTSEMCTGMSSHCLCGEPGTRHTLSSLGRYQVQLYKFHGSTPWKCEQDSSCLRALRVYQCTGMSSHCLCGEPGTRHTLSSLGRYQVQLYKFHGSTPRKKRLDDVLNS